MHDLLITGGLLVDPANDWHDILDLAIEGGNISAVAPDLSGQQARKVLDAEGHLVLPGLVDIHVHISSVPEGHRMLARAGVTCALDMSGRPEPMLAGLQQGGTGLTVGFVYPLIPGDTLSSPNPGRGEVARVLDWALHHGALGVKILGGHYPLSPDATARIIEMAHAKGCWCAVHVGTTTAGSNIEGLEELVELAGGLPLHIAHLNSYCRGQTTGDPLTEASRALRALAQTPRARSESYLARINGTDGSMEQGIPKSEVTKVCLRTGGYAPTASGMEKAIEDGWAQVHGRRDGEIVLLAPGDGLDRYSECDTQVHVSFPVNSPGAAIAIAVAKEEGEFVVPALGTDGGALPRNTTLRQGLALVQFGAFSLEDLTRKACLNPARLLGLEAKGHLSPGADGDIVVVDQATAEVKYVVAGGQVIVNKGQLAGHGGQMITTAVGTSYCGEQAIASQVVAPDWLTAG